MTPCGVSEPFCVMCVTLQALGNSVHTLSQKVHHLVDHFKAFHEAFSSQAAKVGGRRGAVARRVGT